jgi:hypothetical protein
MQQEDERTRALLEIREPQSVRADFMKAFVHWTEYDAACSSLSFRTESVRAYLKRISDGCRALCVRGAPGGPAYTATGQKSDRLGDVVPAMAHPKRGLAGECA